MSRPIDTKDGRSKDELVEEIERLRARVRELERPDLKRHETERQELEVPAQETNERFSIIMKFAKDAILCIDSSLKIVFYNGGAEETFGYSAEEVLGQELDMLLPQQFRGAHAAQIASFGKSDGTARFMSDRTEIYGLCKDGTEFPAEASITRFQIQGETYFGAVLRDMTERKAMEESLRESGEEMKAQLIELQCSQERYEVQGAHLVEVCEDLAQARDAAVYANHAKSEFLAHMSHEIRTPLNSILGFSEVISDQILGPISPLKYHEYAQDIFSSGTHLLQLINDILDLSKVEAGKLDVQDEDFDVGHAILASLRFVTERANKAGLILNTDLPNELPPLHADERMVKQMLINLLTNAIKFTKAGGEVTVSATLDKNSGLSISVCDTGIGIAADELSKVFEAFGQASNSRAQSEEGTGLGLTLVKSLIELHGGTLDLRSELDVGTTVTLCFPPQRVLSDAEAAVA